MKLFLNLIGLVLILGGTFYLICYIVKLWTGGTMEQAAVKVQSFFGDPPLPPYSLASDPGFEGDVARNVASVIGETRFRKLPSLSNANIKTPLLAFIKHCGVSAVIITINAEDETEKLVLENVLINLVEWYLQVHNLDTRTFARWVFRRDLQLPVLEICHAVTEDERHALSILLQRKQQETVAFNRRVVDDTEREDLND